MAARLGRSRPASAYLIYRKQIAPAVPAVIDVTLGGITQDFVATPGPPEAVIGVTLNQVVAAFAGDSTGGSFAVQLAGVTQDFAGQIINGTFAVQLSGVTQTFAGAVNPSAAFTMQLSPVTVLFGSETTPFGEHVIHVEPERRAFNITDELMTPIYRDQVTDL